MALMGKLSENHVNDFLSNHKGLERSEVIQAAAFGVDVSAVELNEQQYLLQCSDPLSYIPQLGAQKSAWLSLVLLANDMATTGCSPQFAQLVMNMPGEMPEEEFKAFYQWVHQYAKTLGISITGGHSSFIPGYNSTLAGGGTLSCIADKNKVRFSHMAQDGDLLFMSKHAGISSASILSLSFPKTIKKTLGAKCLKELNALFFESSALEAGLLAGKHEKVTAMHDVTEGGVLGAAIEMSIAAKLAIELNEDEIPVLPSVNDAMQLFELDAKRSIGAGAMLIACKPDGAKELNKAFAQSGIKLSQIGRFKRGTGVAYGEEQFESTFTDAYWQAYFDALKQGWK